MVPITCFAGNMGWGESQVAFRSAKGHAFAERKTDKETPRLPTPAALNFHLLLNHAENDM